MIEVMVSLLVLSAGLTVIGAMQTRAVFNSSDAVLQAYLAQVLLSFGEARMVDYNAATGTRSYCNGGPGLDIRSSDTAYFKGLVQSKCGVNSKVFDKYPDTSPSCNVPTRASNNVYCPSERFLVDFRQPVWIH